ncbi:hypothetical protein V6N12_030041 [Hibiscus sabdariffa]|uniref:Uncharacterized protein n=1 Tax=Hibiscus sabdariffa TaxID=183260 RepID=A0ABR2CJ61_9ROSI
MRIDESYAILGGFRLPARSISVWESTLPIEARRQDYIEVSARIFGIKMLLTILRSNSLQTISDRRGSWLSSNGSFFKNSLNAALPLLSLCLFAYLTLSRGTDADYPTMLLITSEKAFLHRSRILIQRKKTVELN